MALFSHISPLFIISSPSLGPRPNSGRASPGSMTSMATSTLCAPVHPWRLTSLHTRRSEPPHRRSPVVCPKFPTLSSKNLTDFTPIFTVKLNNCLSILLWWIKLCKKKKKNNKKTNPYWTVVAVIPFLPALSKFLSLNIKRPRNCGWLPQKVSSSWLIANRCQCLRGGHWD